MAGVVVRTLVLHDLYITMMAVATITKLRE
jgi:hypothetical protein